MREIDRLFEDYAGDGQPGASVLVLRGEEVIVRRAFGMADLEGEIPAAPQTNYRLASVTKQFTAAAILALAERGALHLDDAVRKWLPSLPSDCDRVTIRHLLTHTSGLVDYEDLLPAEAATQVHDRDVLRLLASHRQTYFAPGSGWRYSNSGYALLALIVEAAAGVSFAESLQREIFEPLGMAATVAHREGVSVVSRRAFGYSRSGEGWTRTDQDRTSAVLGDGGVYSSMDDVAKWLMALDSGAFAAAAESRVDTDAPGVRYGYGWRISAYDGRRAVHHTGESIGFRNALLRLPDERLSVVVLTNRNEGDPMALALETLSAAR